MPENCTVCSGTGKTTDGKQLDKRIHCPACNGSGFKMTETERRLSYMAVALVILVISTLIYLSANVTP